MLDDVLAVAAQSRMHRSPSTASLGLRLTWRTRFIILVGLVVLCLTLLISGVLLVARAQPVPRIPSLPQRYFPGNPLPDDVACYWPVGDHMPHCSINYRGKEIQFAVDAEMQVIDYTLVRAREYTLGELVVSWGSPSGIIQTFPRTYVYWGTRAAYLTGALKPDSQVQFILYDRAPRPTAPWRGFRRRNQ